MDAPHQGGAYFKPHHKSRLAFLVECVNIWCDDRTQFLDDPVNMSAAKASIRKDVENRLGSLDRKNIDYFAAVEFAAFRNELIADALSDKIRQLTTPRPKKGNVRRDIPEHLPLRPSRTIIALRALNFKREDPSASENAIYARTAQYFIDGIPKHKADGRLKTRSVRTACESHGFFDDPEAAAANYKRALERHQANGSPHPWDCSLYDWLVVGQVLNRLRGGVDDGVAYKLPVLLVVLPLHSFERLYDAARSGRRFAGLLGTDLARAIDATLGLRVWVNNDMNVIAPPTPLGEGRTANALR